MYSNITFVSNKIFLRQLYLFIFLSIVLILNGCMPQNYKPTKTSLELQAFQAKEFETSKKIAFAATLSVFQDLGYIIDSGDFETGLISAKSPTKSGQVWGGSTQEFRKATGFVETIRNNVTKIRLNFVDITKSSSAYGMERGVDVPVEEPKLYQEVFEKIDKAIFVRRNVN